MRHDKFYLKHVNESNGTVQCKTYSIMEQPEYGEFCSDSIIYLIKPSLH